MQAAIVENFLTDFNFNNIEVKQVPKPSVKPGCALVKIHAAAINPADVFFVTGLANDRGLPTSLPYIPGFDLSGVIETVADDVISFKAGDSVMLCNWWSGPPTPRDGNPENDIAGAFAEYITLPVSKLSLKPSHVSHETAAAFVMCGFTIYQAFKVGELKAGSKILILGGSTSLGVSAIQQAKLRGAWVATTCSARSLSFVSQFGADHVINYNEAKWWLASENGGHSGFDAVYNCVSEPDTWAHVQTEGLVVEGGAFVSLTHNELGMNSTAHQPRFRFAAFYPAHHDTEDLNAVLQLLNNKDFKVPVEEVFPLTHSGVVAAFTKVAGGKSLGKNIIKIV